MSCACREDLRSVLARLCAEPHDRLPVARGIGDASRRVAPDSPIFKDNVFVPVTAGETQHLARSLAVWDEAQPPAASSLP